MNELGIILNIALLILIFSGLPLVQDYICARSNGKAGLILPGGFFILAFSICISAFEIRGSLLWSVISIIPLFMFLNIPTVIVYLKYRQFENIRLGLADLDKMKIQDL